MPSHNFADGRCTQCRETQDAVERIGFPCRADEAAMERWWIQDVLSGGLRSDAKIGQPVPSSLLPVPTKLSKKAKKAAEPCLFDGFD